jgi:hypothetical protein
LRPFLFMQKRPMYVCDTECYKDYWAIGFTSVDNPLIQLEYVFWPGSPPLPIAELIAFLSKVTIITFNGEHYDLPMITLALCGYNNAQLKAANDMIICKGVKSWEFYDLYKITRPPFIDHIDLIEPSPGVKISLKVYAGRMFSNKMQDLPIEPSHSITPDLRPLMSKYRKNDESNTLDLYNKIKSRIALRIKMSDQYGIDLRSKSDAQIAEAVIRTSIERATGQRLEKPFWPHGTQFKFKPLPFLIYQTSQLQNAYLIICDAPFTTSDKDQVLDEEDENGNKIKTGIIIPTEIKKLRITLGQTTYKFGYGGLHSQEHSISHIADAEFEISDHDVASFYPRIILNQKLYPKQIGPLFTGIYNTLVETRLSAKKICKELEHNNLTDDLQYEEQVTIMEGGKVTINGSFGKFGSKYSILFSPDLMIQTTISGQLCLLMLIEMLELNGVSVVSANTDGIVIKCPRAFTDRRDYIIKWWETTCQYETEKTEYDAIYQRDVNNYIALKHGKEPKLKGIFAPPGLQKNPNNSVCVKAVVELITHKTPIEQTIFGETDIKQFLSVHSVKGSAVKGDIVLGKAVRWYYGLGETGTINYKTNGNKVPRSDGAVPLMNLPNTLPANIDYGWYIREAYKLLTEIDYK